MCKLNDIRSQAHYSTGAVAAGFTSTVMPTETTHQAAVIAEDLVRYERVKKKGKLLVFSIRFYLQCNFFEAIYLTCFQDT